MPKLGGLKLYGLLKNDFQRERIKIGRDKLFDLLRHEHMLIKKKKKYVKTTDSRHWMRKYPNLIKNIEISRPEQIWVADITYIETKKGFNYLHLITDAYSKKIMGYQLSEDMSASATVKALRMALLNRNYTSKLIHHSDRGLQYCSAAYTKVLQENKIKISMTEQSDPYENAIAERINGILKQEFSLDEVFEDTVQAEKHVNQSIRIYNSQRPHLSCHMLTPVQMHSQKRLKVKKWNKKPQTFAKSEV